MDFDLSEGENGSREDACRTEMGVRMQDDREFRIGGEIPGAATRIIKADAMMIPPL
jgi:hypothetical protein